jgi:hypothetical protein
MSRCGSTLLSQMLAASPKNIVISEAPSVDGVVSADFHERAVSDEQRQIWLRGMISALGRRRLAMENRLFIKFQSWHTLDLPMIQRAFPRVPWVFLYRDPLEVMAAHQQDTGGCMIPGVITPAVRQIPLEAALFMGTEEYQAQVLAHILSAALEHAGPRGRFVNYNELPEAGWGPISEHFGLSLQPDEISGMRKRAQNNAKVPDTNFSADGVRKRAAATLDARRACEARLNPLYERLQAARLAFHRPLSNVLAETNLHTV